MKFEVTINNVKTVNRLDGYWANDDYVKLLEELDYPDANSASPAELIELLQLAISDFEPSDAAEVFLKYKLSDVLTDGQIQNLSHEMIEDKVAEEYPDPSLHYDLFNINQLLYIGYNGKFPNTEATIINATFMYKDANLDQLTKEMALKAISTGLKASNLLNRLYENQMNGTEEFTDAVNVLWEMKKIGENEYMLVTSNYWIEKEDFEQEEFISNVTFFEED